MKRFSTMLSIILAMIISVTAFGCNNNKTGGLAFKDTMPTETYYNATCDLTSHITVPEGKTAVLKATYILNGAEKSYLTVGLTFKPINIGDVKIVVTLKEDAKKTITKTIKVVTPAPIIKDKDIVKIETGTTITFSELISKVKYDSAIPATLKGLKLTKDKQEIDVSDKASYLFAEVGEYTLDFTLSNASGATADSLQIIVSKLKPANEIADLSNSMVAGSGGSARVEMVESERTDISSSWQWKIYADPTSNVRHEGARNDVFAQHGYILFNESFDASKQYVTFDAQRSADHRDIFLIEYLTKDGAGVNPWPEQQGTLVDTNWASFSTEKHSTFQTGIYWGVRILVLHPTTDGSYKTNESTHNVNNVYLTIDNMKVVDRPVTPVHEVNDISNKVTGWKDVSVEKVTEERLSDGVIFSSYNQKLTAGKVKTEEQIAVIYLSEYLDTTTHYITFDAKRNANHRDVFLIDFIFGTTFDDAGIQGTTPQTDAAIVNADQWYSVSTAKINDATHKNVTAIRLLLQHPITGEYNEADVGLFIDNIKIVAR